VVWCEEFSHQTSIVQWEHLTLHYSQPCELAGLNFPTQNSGHPIGRLSAVSGGCPYLLQSSLFISGAQTFLFESGKALASRADFPFLIVFPLCSEGTPYKLCRNTNAGFHVRRDSNSNISNKKLLLEFIVLQCTLYKFIYFLIQLEQCLTPKSPCKGGNPHHYEGKNPWPRQQPQHSKHNKSVGAY
jgi:hypothetical protein